MACARVCLNIWFFAGLLINSALLALTLWAALTDKPFNSWIFLLFFFIIGFVAQVLIVVVHLREPLRLQRGQVQTQNNEEVPIPMINITASSTSSGESSDGVDSSSVVGASEAGPAAPARLTVRFVGA